jgi:hypothetical protein
VGAGAALPRLGESDVSTLLREANFRRLGGWEVVL